jgi:hypothetical protein
MIGEVFRYQQVKYPTISQMMTYGHRRAFFARVLGVYAFKFSSLKWVRLQK